MQQEIQVQSDHGEVRSTCKRYHDNISRPNLPVCNLFESVDSSGDFEGIRGNAVPIVEMSSGLKFYFCRLLCAKNAVDTPSNISNSPNFPAVIPPNPFAGAHPTPTFIHARPALHAVRPSSSILIVHILIILYEITAGKQSHFTSNLVVFLLCIKSHVFAFQ